MKFSFLFTRIEKMSSQSTLNEITQFEIIGGIIQKLSEIISDRDREIALLSEEGNCDSIISDLRNKLEKSERGVETLQKRIKECCDTCRDWKLSFDDLNKTRNNEICSLNEEIKELRELREMKEVNNILELKSKYDLLLRYCNEREEQIKEHREKQDLLKSQLSHSNYKVRRLEDENTRLLKELKRQRTEIVTLKSRIYHNEE